MGFMQIREKQTTPKYFQSDQEVALMAAATNKPTVGGSLGVVNEVEDVVDAVIDMLEDGRSGGKKDPALRFGPEGKRKSELWSLGIICLSYSTLFLSQNALAPVLSIVASDFGLNDMERDRYLGAYMSLGLCVLSLPAAGALGMMADCMHRKRLLVGLLVLGHVGCLLTAVSSTFWQLFTSRMLSGVAMGGALPVVYSLMADLFSAAQRSRCSSAITTSTGAGIILGQMLAGLAGPVYGWRVPFMLCPIPGLVTALLLFFSVGEALRGGKEDQLKEMIESGISYNQGLDWRRFCEVMKIPTNRILIWQGLPGSLPWGVIFVYFSDYLSQEKELSVEAATFQVGLFGLGAAVGAIAGGLIGQHTYQKSPSSLCVMMGSTTIVSMLPMFFVVNADFTTISTSTLALCTLAAGAVASVNGPNIRALLLNVNVPEARGAVICVANLVNSFGRGVGPLLASCLITVLGGRGAAINCMLWAWGLAGAALLMLVLTLEDDQQAMRTKLEAVKQQSVTVELKTKDPKIH